MIKRAADPYRPGAEAPAGFAKISANEHYEIFAAGFIK